MRGDLSWSGATGLRMTRISETLVVCGQPRGHQVTESRDQRRAESQSSQIRVGDITEKQRKTLTDEGSFWLKQEKVFLCYALQLC